MRNVFVLMEKVVTSKLLLNQSNCNRKELRRFLEYFYRVELHRGVRHGAQCISSYAGDIIMNDNKFRYSIDITLDLQEHLLYKLDM